MRFIESIANGCLAAIAAFVMAVAVSFSAWAFQPDASFLTAQKQNAAKWAAEDKAVDAKLAALEKRFGKKPNIIYILADDVGWGELGWPGGHGGLPNMDFYNVRRDPGEKRGEFSRAFMR